MDNIEFTKEESLVATRYFSELTSLRFVLENVSSDLSITESELSLAEGRLEYLKGRVASLVETKDVITNATKSAEDNLDQAIQAVFSRLDKPDSGTVDYRVETNELGDVTGLVRSKE